ncbi:thioredoxin [Paenibacillaceae bacterium]|nr:thioredoxin [Paenibacillaceae bacterium]
MEQHTLKEFQYKAAIVKEALLARAEETTVNMHSFFGRKPKYVLFLSISSGEERAVVFCGIGNSPESGWLNAMNKANSYMKERHWNNVWLKADLVNEIEACSSEQWLGTYGTTRKNYCRKGLSLDSQFNCAFLEQEINANVFVTRNEQTSQIEWNVNHINRYLAKNRCSKQVLGALPQRDVYQFTTISYFYDTALYELHNGSLNNGRRKVDRIDKQLLYQIIDEASSYLARQVDDNGKFIYGYFPSFDKKIPWYNMLRHASTIYSMIEAYEITRSARLAASIDQAIRYLLEEGIIYSSRTNEEQRAYVVDWENDQEIKLGANAAAILALAKYSTVFQTDQYVQLMNLLASGIAAMQNVETGGFVHVLRYPDLTVKETFRIIYYDGEAAFALIRLYAVTRDPKWLAVVERAFAYFMKHNYWKHHDHWLSYCTNELTQYKPEADYFTFGLRNVRDKLNFIIDRDTTYPTFLELLMASHKMINNITSRQMTALLDGFDTDKLNKAISHRLEHQLNGFFFPEVAMYFKAPAKITGSFYIRHHSFRSRIDDVEHNISGYCSYYHEFLHHEQAAVQVKEEQYAKEI